MITEEQIKELAYSIWEQEGRPNGKDVEHYFYAKALLEAQESSKVIELASPPPKIPLESPLPTTGLTSPPPTVTELGTPQRSKRGSRKKR